MQKNLNRYFFICAILLNHLVSSAQRIDSVDVLHYSIEASIRNLSTKQIDGKTTLVALANFNQTKTITIDLQKLIVSAVSCNGISAGFRQSDSTISIDLNQILSKNDTAKIVITYSGSPVTDARWGGFYFNGNYAYNMGVGMASNPPNFGRCWFPCIDNFTDRATYEFHITTDSGFMAVCNGIQSPVTPASSNGLTWHWKLGQEIPTYIANVAVSKYVLVNQIFHGIKRDIPITLAVEPKDTNNIKASFFKLSNALECFENKFGPYEFDRVGYVGVPFTSGAMEHAGNISYPLYAVDGSTSYETLFAHELSHHWFGNLVTSRTASDMWLNEGWASYCEALFLECVYGRNAYEEKINSELFEVLRWAHARDKAYLPVSGVPLAQTYGTHVYTKGSMMVHSLRTLINDDTAFFNSIKSYLLENRFKDVSSKELQSHFEKRFGGMIGSFFNSYIYDKGHVDLQLVGYQKEGVDKLSTRPVFKLMSRHKSVLPDTIYTYINYFSYAGTGFNNYLKMLVLDKSSGYYKGDFGFQNYTGNAVIGQKTGTMLGTSTQMQWVKGTGVQTFPNALLTFTPQQNPDSNLVIVEHHFAGPWQESKNNLNGIRISSERYWHITGAWQSAFKASAFFNYDGTTPSTGNSGYLDNELITGMEDSLVLLYRKDASFPFEIESDLTKQMGPSKTDKTGRFWVNNLKQGDYVFGYKDIHAGISEMSKKQRKLNLFPNPADSQIAIEFPEKHSEGKLHIINLKGQELEVLTINQNVKNISIQLNNYLSGTYFMIFEDDFGKLTQTFVVH